VAGAWGNAKPGGGNTGAGPATGTMMAAMAVKRGMGSGGGLNFFLSVEGVEGVGAGVKSSQSSVQPSTFIG
jgi:hypothetical protein